MASYEDRERFIPFRKSEIVDLICTEGCFSKEEQESFRIFSKILESLYHFEFHGKVESLKENYYSFNPDKDTKTTRELSKEEILRAELKLVEQFKEVLNDANFEEIPRKELLRSMQEESIFKIKLFVDLEDFDSLLLFSRGEQQLKLNQKRLLFFKRELEVPGYERVVLLLKFKDADYFQKMKRKELMFEPGAMLIKLFKEIPKADLEMLFPNIETRMKPKDKLMMGGPALAGGVGIILKTGAGLLALISVLWLFVQSLFGGAEINLGDKVGEMLAGLSALSVIGGYLFRQWVKYRTRKIEFMKKLADSLYFKNLDNNAGVFHHIIDAAEEEECKEALLGYYFLLISDQGYRENELDDRVESWFEQKYGTLIDFEVDDALRKLKELGLCFVGEGEDPTYRVLSLDDACKRLDFIWDNYFQYN